jgi:hypothetical protein
MGNTMLRVSTSFSYQRIGKVDTQFPLILMGESNDRGLVSLPVKESEMATLRSIAKRLESHHP